MNRYCSECNATMTPSLVGYLCPDCGHMQRFYASATQETMTKNTAEQLSAGSNAEQADEPVMVTAPAKNETPEQKKIRSTLKRLMVPELAPPHHEQIILEDEPQPIEPEKAEATLYRPDNEPAPNQAKPHSIDQPVHKSKTWLWILLSVVTLIVLAIGILILNSPRST